MHGSHDGVEMGHYHMATASDGTIDGKGHPHLHSGGEHAMKMWFHSGYSEIILFECWQINSLTGNF